MSKSEENKERSKSAWKIFLEKIAVLRTKQNKIISNYAKRADKERLKKAYEKVINTKD